jgi:hypothetical protein
MLLKPPLLKASLMFMWIITVLSHISCNYINIYVYRYVLIYICKYVFMYEYY